jgi:outer membrane receptor protein involved in Fe transport
MKNRLLLTIVASGMAIFACAQSNDSTILRGVMTDTLNEVIISASRHPERVFTAPFSIDRMRTPMNELHNARTLPEAMAYMPGVFVQKTNHGGGSPFLRGLTGNQTLLMLDGIRVNNAAFRFGPNQYPNVIDAYTLERIEVLKGSGSVQYGSDAMGGVIHAITNDIRIGERIGWDLRAGGRITTQDMEYTGRANATFAGKGFGISGGYTLRQFGDLVGGDTTGKQTPSGYSERDWNLKAKFALGEKYTLTASAQQVTQHDVPLYHRVKLENFEYYNFEPQKMLISYARLQANLNRGALKGWSITPLYKKSTEGRQYHRNGHANYFEEKDIIETFGVVAETDWQILPFWTSGTGVEYYNDKVGSGRNITNNGNTTSTRGLYPDGAKQINTSIYSLHHFTWKNWRAEAGVRYNRVENQVPAKNLNLPGAVFADAEMVSDAWVGNASLLYELNNTHAFFSNISSGFRAPNIDDLGTLGLVDFRYEIPAYHLDPERNLNTELGYRFRTRKLQLQATAFYMHLSDLIGRVRKGTDSLEGYPVFVKTNDQESFVKGFEFSGSYEPVNGLTFSGMFSVQYGENLSRNEPMRRIPPTHGLFNAKYAKQRWYAAAEMQWADEQDRLAQGDKDDNRIPKGGTPAWQVVNVHGGYQLRFLQLRATLFNLFNEDYRTHGSGINGMGRAVTLSAMFTFSTKK